MGFDVTFHPFRREEFKTYVEAIVKNPTVYQKQVESLHPEGEERQFINETLYGHFAGSIPKILNNEALFDKTIGFSAAAIFGYLHPYWYARGGLLSKLLANSTFGELASSWNALAKDDTQNVFEQANDLVQENYSSGCLILFEQLEEFERRLNLPENHPVVDEAIGAGDNLDSLNYCLQYCLEHQLDLLEASDVFVPFSGEHYTFSKNFRAAHLKNLDDLTNHSESTSLAIQ